MSKTKIDKNQRYILLDTNIISRLSGEFGEKIIEIMKEVVGYGYGIAISDIVFFEVLDEASVEKEMQIIETLSGVTRFYVRKNVLIAAAHLGSLYKEHNLPPAQFASGDKIIAATALLNNSLVLTLNGRDFPQPFFKELDRRIIESNQKGFPNFSPVYFLEPQADFINRCHSDRTEVVFEKIKKSQKSR